MTLHSMKEIWMPLMWFGIKTFKILDDDGACYIKVGNKPRKRMK